uniref:Uncharacterized protein n=1 Tax=Caenorhabditis japonica TaxID=281687 RepID=A0A8R1HJM2_CAEJA
MDCECGDENEFDNDEKQNNNDESCQEDQYPPDNHSAPPYPESPTEGGLESVDFRFSDDHIRNEEPFFKGYAQTNNYNTTYIPQWRPLEGVNYESSQEEIEISREELQKQRNKIASANYLERLNERMEALETDAREIILSNDHMQFKNQQKLKFMQLAVDSLLPILDDNNQNQIEFDVNAIRQLVHNFEQEKLLIQKTVENNRKEDIEMADKLEEWTNAEEELKKAEYNLENKEEMMPILMIREDTLACRVFRNHRLKNIAFYKYKICCLIHDKEEQRQLSKRLDFHLGFLRPHDRRIHNDLWKDLYHAIEKRGMQDQMEWSYGGTDHYDYVKNPDIQKNNYHSFHQDQYPPDNQIASPCLEIPTEGGLESVDFQFSDNHNRNKKLNFKGYAETNNANTTYEVLDQHKQQWQQLEGVNYQRSPDLQEEIQISREEMQKQRNKIASANYLERLNERMEASERDALVIILSNDHMQFKNQQKLKFMQLAVDSLFLILDDNNQNEIDFDVNAIRQLVHNFEQEKLLIEKTVENNRKEDIDMADKLKVQCPVCPRIRAQLFDSIVLPALTYGSEVWTFTQALSERVRVTHAALERRLVGISLSEQRQRNLHREDIRAQSEVRDPLLVIKKKKLGWAGHIMRRNDGRWTRLVQEWYPIGEKRPVGRPRMRWSDSLKEEISLFDGNHLKTHWSTIAKDRMAWKAEWKKAEEKLKDDEYNLKNKEEMMPILGIKEGTFGSRCTRSRQNVRTAFCEYQIRFESHEQDKQRRLSKLLDYHLDFLRPHVRPILSNWLMNSHHPVETWSAEEIGAYHYFLYRDAG